MSTRKLLLALALVAMGGVAAAENAEPQREPQPAASSSAQQQPAPTQQASSPDSREQAATAAEPRDTPQKSADSDRARRHPGASQKDIDFAQKYYPGG